MNFKEWLLKEIGTSTGCIATFSRISIPLVRRTWPFEEDDDKRKKRKKIKESVMTPQDQTRIWNEVNPLMRVLQEYFGKKIMERQYTPEDRKAHDAFNKLALFITRDFS